MVEYNLRKGLLEPRGSNARLMGCRFSYWNCTSPQECIYDINVCWGSARMLTFRSSIRVVTRYIRCPISRQLQKIRPPAWTVSCWHAGSTDSRVSLHTHTRPSALYKCKQHSSDKETWFQWSTAQWRWWRSKARHEALCRTVNNGTWVG